MAAKAQGNARVVAHNRRARFNYEIGETFEAGIALTGTEVKSLRQGKATIAESYADARGGDRHLVIERDCRQQANTLGHCERKLSIPVGVHAKRRVLDQPVKVGIAETAAIALPEVAFGVIAVQH